MVCYGIGEEVIWSCDWSCFYFIGVVIGVGVCVYLYREWFCLDNSVFMVVDGGVNVYIEDVLVILGKDIGVDDVVLRCGFFFIDVDSWDDVGSVGLDSDSFSLVEDIL